MASTAWNFITTPLWSVKQFSIETDNGWGRSHLRRIDAQLAKAKQAEGNPPQYAAELGRLIDECRTWMISKEKKFARKAKTRSYEKRLNAVTTLMGMAILHLKHLAFAERKQQGAQHSLVSLKPGYDRERTEFEAMKQNTSHNRGLRLDPHSSSFVTAGVQSHMRPNRGWYPHLGALLDKDVASMTDDEFADLSKELKRDWGIDLSMGGFLPRVHYVRKMERISSNMLLPIAGLLYKDTAHHPYTSSGPDGKDIYAMDKYGNLMSAPGSGGFDDGTFKSEYRHSSLNAGNAVVCAGFIQIEQGIVKYIDNKSGHYKPSEKDLARALLIMMNEHDLDLSKTRVVGYRAAGPNSVVKHADVTGGVAFTNVVVPPPPFPPPF